MKTYVPYGGCGGLPWMEQVANIEDCEVMLLTGGSDINPALYGEENTYSVGISNKRDSIEVEAVNKAIELNIPIVGICRGYQLLHVMNGGKLIQHIDGHEYGSHLFIPYHEKITHFITNSCHHQLPDVGKGDRRVLGISHDNLPEAMAWRKEGGDKLDGFGVQYHPEWLPESSYAHQFFKQHVEKLVNKQHQYSPCTYISEGDSYVNRS